MTKLKNTKKGMAKKALSISLVAAMLATSNVPVWAAEDLFSDGSTAVEAPAVEEPAAEVDTFSAEPVEEITPAVETQATSTNDDYKVTVGTDFENAVKNGIVWNEVDGDGGKTFTGMSISPSVPAGNNIKYVWKDKSGNAITDAAIFYGSATLDLKDQDSAVKYAGQDVTLYIYVEAATNNNAIVWDYTSDPIRIQPVEISNVSLTFDGGTDFTYTGKEIKPAITNKNIGGYDIDAKDLIIDYSGDVINVGTVNVTAVVNKQGYAGTLTGEYDIISQTLTAENIDQFVNVSLKNTSMPFTGNSNYNIYASDVILTDKETGADVSYLLKKDSNNSNRVGVLAKENVGEKGKATVALYSEDNKKNFIVNTPGITVETQNEMTIVERDLSTVTAAMNGNIKYDGDAVTSNDLLNAGITYKDANGNSLDLNDQVKITVPSNAIEAGTYTATIEPTEGNKNVTKSTTVKFTIYQEDISKAKFEKVSGNTLSAETYTGKQITKDVSTLGKVYIDTDDDNTCDAGETVLRSSDYEITYGTNTDAGTGAGKLYIVGKGDYAGTKAEYTFDINQATLDKLSASQTVEYIPGADEEDYKDALGLKVTASEGKITLVEGEDYTVEYTFNTENKPGNKVKATVTLKDTKNFALPESFINTKEADITYAQLKDSDIVMNQTSYEYTGKTIEPDFDLVVNGRTISPDNYTVSISNGINAGTASFTVTAKTGSLAIAGSAKGTFTITPADMSKVDVVIPAQAYTGYSIIPEAKDFDVTFSDVEYTDAAAKEFIEKNFKLSYGENIDMGENAGTVTLTPKTNNKNFTGTKTVTFTISGTMLSGGSLKYYDENGLIVNDISFEYDGKAHTPAKTVYANDKYTLTEGTDYEIQYVDNVYGKKDSNGKQYGAVLVIAKGKYAGNYANATYGVKDGIYTTADGTKISSVAYAEFFEITPLTINAKNVSVENGTYAAGFQVKPEVTISVDGVILTEGKDYQLKFDDSQDRINVTSKKSLTVEVEGINGYRGTGLKFNWGIDKFNLANADVSVNGDAVTVKCGKVDIDASEYTVSTEGNTVTVTAKEDSKNYTGSKTIDVELEDEKPEAPVIQSVEVNGNNATVILEGESDGATGYDFVIDTDRNCINDKEYYKVNKNILTTQTTFTYTGQNTYYAYCHAWKRVDGVKVFSDWSAAYPFVVTSVTPEQPSITKVEKSSNGKHLRVTWTKSTSATGYDVVMGTKLQKVNGEYRPVEYGKAVKKVTNGNTVSVIFYNIPKGTYYVGLHAYNRSSESGVKVFSPWSNSKKVTF